MDELKNELGRQGISLPKTYIFNFEKIKTLKDVIRILKLLKLEVSWHGECPEEYKELFNNGYLIDITEFKKK